MTYRGHLELVTADAGDHVTVSVIDDGPGIPEGIVDRIFEPFFTTKPSGEGSGLGLHICERIVTRHGGTIMVESAPHRTAFTVALPKTGARAVAS